MSSAPIGRPNTLSCKIVHRKFFAGNNMYKYLYLYIVLLVCSMDTYIGCVLCTSTRTLHEVRCSTYLVPRTSYEVRGRYYRYLYHRSMLVHMYLCTRTRTFTHSPPRASSLLCFYYVPRTVYILPRTSYKYEVPRTCT